MMFPLRLLIEVDCECSYFASKKKHEETIAIARAEQERSAMRIAPRPNECRYVYAPVLVPELNANGRVVYRQRQGVTLVCAKCVKAGNG